ncbi:MAG: hypothetical protein K2H85_01185, partial [Allobaculum sp.]|nr:hypothetical protein [Allobaculum sp.]
KYKEQYKQLGCYVPIKPLKIFSGYLTKNSINSWQVVPENIICNYVSPILNPIAFRKVYEDKNIYGKLFKAEALPKTLLRKMGGINLTENYIPIDLTNQQLTLVLIEYNRVIVKPTIDTSSGRGVKLFERGSDNEFHLVNQDEVILTSEFLDGEYGNNYIIQECIEQSDFMAALNKDSVNTFRIGSYRSVEDNQPKILFVGIRMGVKGSYVDNTHAGGAKIRVNMDGTLADYAVEGFGDIVETHNDINFKTHHLKVPNFDKIISFVKNLHLALPHMRLVAFDVMLDKNNEPKLIEYNISGFSTWLPQWTGQNVLGDYTDEIINYCAKNKDKALKVAYFIN